MVGHMPLPQEFYDPCADLPTGAIGFEGRDSVFTTLRDKKTIAEKFLARRFLGIQRSPESGELGNAFWIPAAESPDDGIIEVRSDMGPLLRPAESGASCPGTFRPFRGISPE